MTNGQQPADVGDVASAATVEQFDLALGRLAAAKPFARGRYQPDVLRVAGELLDSASGTRALYERAGRFEEAGVFHGGPWADAHALQASLVTGCLLSDSNAATMETLSELRMLAAATGRAPHGAISEGSARKFLRDVVALNLDLLFPLPAEPTPTRSPLIERSRRLFALIGAELSLDGLRVEVTEEVLDLAAQRPIVTTRIKKLISLASNLPPTNASQGEPDALERFQRCIHGPSPLSRQHRDPAAYREALNRASRDVAEQESIAFGRSLRETGIAHDHHAVLLRRLATNAPDLLPKALGLCTDGADELKSHAAFVAQLIRAVIVPGTSDCILGLACVLERRVLSLAGVVEGLRDLIELDVLPTVAANLTASRQATARVDPNTRLAAGALSVLGQPLGIGQGRNPTCQATRCISLWAAHDSAFLLRVVAQAARDGWVQAAFEGAAFRSDEVKDSPLDAADTNLDPVQVVLVPHLNRIYDGLIARTGLRGVDAHKWVNPAMYGRWVPKGFASCVDPITAEVIAYDDFLARFFATHHPSFNDNATLPYPNPVGLLVTDAHGRYLGPHAVAIQRVARDAQGNVRVYFFNPNNDGRQRWAPNITPAVRGFGEIPGESSLPFHQFASRIYAFHFDPYQQGDAYAVPRADLDQVRDLVRTSWESAFTWRQALT